MDIRSAVNLGPRVQVHFKGKGRTKQADRDSCDINLIMRKYVKTGLIDHFGQHGGDYGFATSVSFHEAMNVVTKADQMFSDLPGEVRRRFNGEPGEFLDFVQNPENAEEMRELGLRDPETVAEVVEVRLAAEVESPPEAPEESARADDKAS